MDVNPLVRHIIKFFLHFTKHRYLHIYIYILSNVVYIKKVHRGATLVHRKYIISRMREKNKKVKKANH